MNTRIINESETGVLAALLCVENATGSPLPSLSKSFSIEQVVGVGPNASNDIPFTCIEDVHQQFMMLCLWNADDKGDIPPRGWGIYTMPAGNLINSKLELWAVSLTGNGHSGYEIIISDSLKKLEIVASSALKYFLIGFGVVLGIGIIIGIIIFIIHINSQPDNPVATNIG